MEGRLKNCGDGEVARLDELLCFHFYVREVNVFPNRNVFGEDGSAFNAAAFRDRDLPSDDRVADDDVFADVGGVEDDGVLNDASGLDLCVVADADVRAELRSGADADAVADDGVLLNDDVRADRRLLADECARREDDVVLEPRIFADVRKLSDDAVAPDRVFFPRSADPVLTSLFSPIRA
jgi:hypothetical protein